MNMPVVTKCESSKCAYNDANACHAMAITIGHPGHAHCDTYVEASAKGGVPSVTAGVGACKVVDCRFNDLLACTASGVQVGRMVDEADCQTYEHR